MLLRSSVRLHQWQADTEVAVASRIELNDKVSEHGAHNGLADGKAQTSPLIVTSTIPAGELLEDTIRFVAGYPATIILNVDMQKLVLDGASDINLWLGSGIVFYRIGEDVDQNLAQTVVVNIDDDGLIREVRFDLNRAGAGAGEGGHVPIPTTQSTS